MNLAKKSRKYFREPVFTDFSVYDGNSATSSVTGDNSVIIKGYSKLYVNISSANKMVAQKHATPVKYSMSCDTRQGNANYTIVSSCKQTPNGLQANYCVTTDANVINPLKPNLQKQEIEKELAKIKNTKQMYKDLIASLKEELKSNGIVIVDEGLNLAIKQIELSGSEISALTQDMQYLKDNMLESLGKKYNISKQNIENENAQLVDDLTNMAEKLLSYIPGGDKVTNHYLWRILKSTPEIGKILGNSGAIINIYFQIDEFQKKLQQLEERENALISIEQKDIVIAK